MAKTAGLLTLFIFLSFASLRADSDLFPMPDVIAPNVAFWTKVYATYPTSRGLVHDNLNLNVIYDVIELLPYNAPGADKTNRQRMKTANQKYEQILQRLAENPNCDDTECRRVAALFPEPRTAHQFQQALPRVRCQIGQMDRFREGLIRSGAYIDQIRTIFKTYNLPVDLAYLPHVESSFNTNAYSKAGAAGMWQFTQGTGKRFMQVGYTVDERRDPILATHAAAQLLRENYAHLRDWPLAVTAYNHGTGGMLRAKQQHGDYAQVFQSYQGRSFKFASRNFYSEFLAARQVAADYKTYFGELALAAPVPYRTHVLDGFVSFSKLSQHFGVSPEELKRLNPALRQPVVTGQKHVPKGYALRLPASTESPQSLMAGLIPETLYQKDQKPTRFYTVKRGDTVGKIARAHGVEADELILANNLGKRATILPHQTLRIPTRGEKPSLPEMPLLASNESSSKTASPEIKVAVPAAQAVTPSVKAGTPVAVTASAEKAKTPVEVAATTVLESKAPTAQPTSLVAQAEPPVEVVVAPAVETKAPVVATAAAVMEAIRTPEVNSTTPLLEPKAPEKESKTSILVATAEPMAAVVRKAEPPAAAAAAVPEQPPAAITESQKAIAETPMAASEAPGVETATQKTEPSEPVAAATVKPPTDLEEPATKELPLGKYPQPVLASVIPVAPASPEKEALTLEALRQQVSNDQIVAADVGFKGIIKVNGQPVGVIRIEIEETLGHFADWADVRTQQIRNLNGLSFNSVIHLHQKIKIPLHRVTAEAFEQNRYEYHKRLQEDFFAVYRIGELQDYYVRHGDNYWTLSQSKFDIPMWLLKHCNPETDLADLQINHKLIIPIVEKASADDASPADEQGTEAPNQEEASSRPVGEV
jgi:membrane-bound lytic murein transglycosylase D